MAALERLDNLPMTMLETLLKQCLNERKDIADKILTSEQLKEYVTWMITQYGHIHGKATQQMIPYFTPENEMTRIAAAVAAQPDNKRFLNQLSQQLARQNDADYIAPGLDISIGRMLRYFPGQWHTTTYFSVYYVFSGECPIHFQNEVITLKAGAVLIVAPGVVHATPCYADDSVLIFYMMRASTFNSVFWNQLGEGNLLSKFFHLALNTEQASSYIHFETNSDPDIRHIMLEMYKEHQEDKPYAKQMVNSLMRLFFLQLLRRYEGTARLPRTEYFFWKHQFSAIFSYIQTHYQHATLSTVAQEFNYSTKQVGRIVHEYTGKYFGDLIRDMKMKKAAELLRDHKLTPEQVADIVGYATINSFYRSFTDYYGVPPLEWVEHNHSS